MDEMAFLQNSPRIPEESAEFLKEPQKKLLNDSPDKFLQDSLYEFPKDLAKEFVKGIMKKILEELHQEVLEEFLIFFGGIYTDTPRRIHGRICKCIIDEILNFLNDCLKGFLDYLSEEFRDKFQEKEGICGRISIEILRRVLQGISDGILKKISIKSLKL